MFFFVLFLLKFFNSTSFDLYFYPDFENLLPLDLDNDKDNLIVSFQKSFLILVISRKKCLIVIEKKIKLSISWLLFLKFP